MCFYFTVFVLFSFYSLCKALDNSKEFVGIASDESHRFYLNEHLNGHQADHAFENDLDHGPQTEVHPQHDILYPSTFNMFFTPSGLRDDFNEHYIASKNNEELRPTLPSKSNKGIIETEIMVTNKTYTRDLLLTPAHIEKNVKQFPSFQKPKNIKTRRSETDAESEFITKIVPPPIVLEHKSENGENSFKLKAELNNTFNEHKIQGHLELGGSINILPPPQYQLPRKNKFMVPKYIKLNKRPLIPDYSNHEKDHAKKDDKYFPESRTDTSITLLKQELHDVNTLPTTTESQTMNERRSNKSYKLKSSPSNSEININDTEVTEATITQLTSNINILESRTNTTTTHFKQKLHDVTTSPSTTESQAMNGRRRNKSNKLKSSTLNGEIKINYTEVTKAAITELTSNVKKNPTDDVPSALKFTTGSIASAVNPQSQVISNFIESQFKPIPMGFEFNLNLAGSIQYNQNQFLGSPYLKIDQPAVQFTPNHYDLQFIADKYDQRPLGLLNPKQSRVPISSYQKFDEQSDTHYSLNVSQPAVETSLHTKKYDETNFTFLSFLQGVTTQLHKNSSRGPEILFARNKSRLFLNKTLPSLPNSTNVDSSIEDNYLQIPLLPNIPHVIMSGIAVNSSEAANISISEIVSKSRESSMSNEIDIDSSAFSEPVNKSQPTARYPNRPSDFFIAEVSYVNHSSSFSTKPTHPPSIAIKKIKTSHSLKPYITNRKLLKYTKLLKTSSKAIVKNTSLTTKVELLSSLLNFTDSKKSQDTKSSTQNFFRLFTLATDNLLSRTPYPKLAIVPKKLLSPPNYKSHKQHISYDVMSKNAEKITPQLLVLNNRLVANVDGVLNNDSKIYSASSLEENMTTNDVITMKKSSTETSIKTTAKNTTPVKSILLNLPVKAFNISIDSIVLNNVDETTTLTFNHLFVNDYQPTPLQALEDSTTTSSYSKEINEKLKEGGSFFSVFLETLFISMASMADKHAKQLIDQIVPAIATLFGIRRNIGDYLPRPIIMAVRELPYHIVQKPINESKSIFGILATLIKERQLFISQDLNKILDLVDTLHKSRAKEKMVNDLMDFQKYPNISRSAYQLVYDTIDDAVLTPFFSLNRRMQRKLKHSLNKYIIKNYYRRESITAPMFFTNHVTVKKYNSTLQSSYEGALNEVSNKIEKSKYEDSNGSKKLTGSLNTFPANYTTVIPIFVETYSKLKKIYPELQKINEGLNELNTFIEKTPAKVAYLTNKTIYSELGTIQNNGSDGHMNKVNHNIQVYSSDKTLKTTPVQNMSPSIKNQTTKSEDRNSIIHNEIPYPNQNFSQQTEIAKIQYVYPLNKEAQTKPIIRNTKKADTCSNGPTVSCPIFKNKCIKSTQTQSNQIINDKTISIIKTTKNPYQKNIEYSTSANNLLTNKTTEQYTNDYNRLNKRPELQKRNKDIKMAITNTKVAVNNTLPQKRKDFLTSIKKSVIISSIKVTTNRIPIELQKYRMLNNKKVPKSFLKENFAVKALVKIKQENIMLAGKAQKFEKKLNLNKRAKITKPFYYRQFNRKKEKVNRQLPRHLQKSNILTTSLIRKRVYSNFRARSNRINKYKVQTNEPNHRSLSYSKFSHGDMFHSTPGLDKQSEDEDETTRSTVSSENNDRRKHYKSRYIRKRKKAHKYRKRTKIQNRKADVSNLKRYKELLNKLLLAKFNNQTNKSKTFLYQNESLNNKILTSKSLAQIGRNLHDKVKKLPLDTIDNNDYVYSTTQYSVTPHDSLTNLINKALQNFNNNNKTFHKKLSNQKDNEQSIIYPKSYIKKNGRIKVKPMKATLKYDKLTIKRKETPTLGNNKRKSIVEKIKYMLGNDKLKKSLIKSLRRDIDQNAPSLPRSSKVVRKPGMLLPRYSMFNVGQFPETALEKNNVENDNKDVLTSTIRIPSIKKNMMEEIQKILRNYNVKSKSNTKMENSRDPGNYKTGSFIKAENLLNIVSPYKSLYNNYTTKYTTQFYAYSETPSYVVENTTFTPKKSNNAHNFETFINPSNEVGKDSLSKYLKLQFDKFIPKPFVDVKDDQLNILNKELKPSIAKVSDENTEKNIYAPTKNSPLQKNKTIRKSLMDKIKKMLNDYQVNKKFKLKLIDALHHGNAKNHFVTQSSNVTETRSAKRIRHRPSYKQESQVRVAKLQTEQVLTSKTESPEKTNLKTRNRKTSTSLPKTKKMSVMDKIKYMLNKYKINKNLVDVWQHRFSKKDSIKPHSIFKQKAPFRAIKLKKYISDDKQTEAMPTSANIQQRYKIKTMDESNQVTQNPTSSPVQNNKKEMILEKIKNVLSNRNLKEKNIKEKLQNALRQGYNKNQGSIRQTGNVIARPLNMLNSFSTDSPKAQISITPSSDAHNKQTEREPIKSVDSFEMTDIETETLTTSFLLHKNRNEMLMKLKKMLSKNMKSKQIAVTPRSKIDIPKNSLARESMMSKIKAMLTKYMIRRSVKAKQKNILRHDIKTDQLARRHKNLPRLFNILLNKYTTIATLHVTHEDKPTEQMTTLAANHQIFDETHQQSPPTNSLLHKNINAKKSMLEKIKDMLHNYERKKKLKMLLKNSFRHAIDKSKIKSY